MPKSKLQGRNRYIILFKFFNKHQKINFNCTTDTYFKPQLNICSKCDLIFSDLIYNFNNSSLEENTLRL